MLRTFRTAVASGLSDIPYRERDVSGNGDVLPVMVIDPMTLADLIERLPPIERDEEKMIFEFPENGK